MAPRRAVRPTRRVLKPHLYQTVRGGTGLMSEPNYDLGIEDTSGLNDLDWLEINKCRAAFKTGGEKALREAYEDLSRRDVVRFSRILGAFFPVEYSEALKDYMARNCIAKEDILEMAAKLENPPKKH